MRAVASRSRAYGLLIFLAGMTLLLPVGARGQATSSFDLPAVTSVLEREIERAMLEGQIPSLTIALVAADEILWSAGFGDANLWARTPATPGTTYMVASTFKTMVAAAVLQLMEDGLLDLDDPVRDYLDDDLSIDGERRRNRITFRHLLTHTSGLPAVFSPVPVWADSVPPPLRVHLEENLAIVSSPLERVRYSNLAYALLAQLVEEISGVDFRHYVQNQLLLPLGMTSTEFAPTPEMQERMALPYVTSRDTGRLVPVPQVRFAEWPAGGVWGTVEDQARWLGANLNGGSYQGRRILSEETIASAHTLQYERFTGTMAGGWGDGKAGYGLGWWTTTREGEHFIAHSGSVQGYTSFLHGNVDREVGVAILTNGHRAHPHLVRLSFLATDLLSEHSR